MYRHVNAHSVSKRARKTIQESLQRLRSKVTQRMDRHPPRSCCTAPSLLALGPEPAFAMCDPFLASITPFNPISLLQSIFVAYHYAPESPNDMRDPLLTSIACYLNFSPNVEGLRVSKMRCRTSEISHVLLACHSVMKIPIS